MSTGRDANIKRYLKEIWPNIELDVLFIVIFQLHTSQSVQRFPCRRMRRLPLTRNSEIGRCSMMKRTRCCVQKWDICPRRTSRPSGMWTYVAYRVFTTAVMKKYRESKRGNDNHIMSLTIQ
jgi:hypothetical protein